MVARKNTGKSSKAKRKQRRLRLQNRSDAITKKTERRRRKRAALAEKSVAAQSDLSKKQSGSGRTSNAKSGDPSGVSALRGKRPYGDRAKAARAESAADQERPPQKRQRSEVAGEAKQLWEKLRNIKQVRGQASELVQRLVALLGDDLEGYSHRHDTSRVIQWTLKRGNKDQRRQVIDALLPHVVELSGDRYGRHVVLSMMVKNRATAEQLHRLYLHLQRSVQTMSRSRHSAEVLDCFFQTMATAAQRTDLALELLYGSQSGLFDALRKQKSSSPPATFADALAASLPEYTNVVLEAAKSTLTTFCEKEDMVRLSILHRALREYLDFCVSRDRSMAVDMAMTYAPSAVHLVHTRDGVRCVAHIVRLLDAKMRKRVVKSIQTETVKVAEDEFGHMALMCLLEHVDDTKLLSKSILKMLTSSDQAMLSTLGHRHAGALVLHLLAPRQGRYFHPHAYAFIWTGESSSLKDSSTRREELLHAVWPQLTTTLVEHGAQLLTDAVASRVLLQYVVEDSLLPAGAEDQRQSIVQTVARAFQEALADTSRESEAEQSVLNSDVAVKTVRYLLPLTAGKAHSMARALASILDEDLGKLRGTKAEPVLVKMAQLGDEPGADAASAALRKT